MNEIQIACCFNEDFALPTGVMIQSLLQNCSKKVKIYLIVDGTVTDASIKKFHHFENQFNCTMQVILFDLRTMIPESDYQDIVKNCDRYSLNALSRFFLPNLIPETSKLIYLDGDIIILDDISKLWNISIDGKACGAVTSSCKSHSVKSNRTGQLVNIYFNSGVLLMDIAKMRSLKLSEVAWEYYKTNYQHLQFCDQDTLNAILDENVSLMPLKWNFYSSLVHPEGFKEASKATKIIIQDIITHQDWGIIHFNGPIKPWGADGQSFGPFAGMWWFYFDQSPWKSDNSAKNARKKHRSILGYLRWILYRYPSFNRIMKRNGFLNCGLKMYSFFFESFR